MKQFDYHPGPSSRCNIIDTDGEGRELHCGDCFDLHTSKGVKVPVRIELSADWYLVGVSPSSAVAWDRAEVSL